jgi:hypothetical protein
MKIEEENIDVDILGSVEFDLSEGIKDLIWNIKLIKKDVDNIKEHLDL